MKKKLVAVLLVMALGLVGLSSCGGNKDESKSGDTIEWSFYSAYGPEDGACCEVWQDLFDKVYEETDGKLKITTYWYGQHPYEGEEMLKTVQDGTAQLTHFYSGYVESVEPSLAVEGLPLLFPTDPNKSYEILSGLWGNFEQDKNGALENILETNWNATMVHCMPASPQRLFTTGYDGTKANSLKGHKIRTYNTSTSEFVEALGGTPVSISLSETYTGLSTNLVDGLITSTLFGYNSGVFDYVDTVNVWEIAAGTDGIMCNMDALNSLPDDVRETFLRVMNESATAPETVELEKNDKLLKQLEGDGVKVIEPTEKFRNSVRDILEKEVWSDWLKDAGENGKIVLEQVKKQL